MAEEKVDQREGPPDRRHQSAIADPRFWVAVCGVLLALTTTVFGFMYARFSELLAAQQAMLVVVTEERTERRALDERVRKLEDRFTQAEKDQNAFNFNLSTRLATAEAVHNMTGGKK